MGGASDGSGFSIKGRRELLVRVPVGFINASGVGKGAMVEMRRLQKLSFSAGSSSNESYPGLGEVVALDDRLKLELGAADDPKSENLLLEIGTLKFGVTQGSLLVFDVQEWLDFRESPSTSTASSA